MKKLVALFAVLALLTLCVLPACAQGEILTGPSEPVPESALLTAETYPLPGEDIILIAPAPVGDADQKDTFTGSEELLDTLIPPTTGAQPEEDGFMFVPGNFVANLSYMATGMIGIFIVIGLIILGTVVLNKLFKEKGEKTE